MSKPGFVAEMSLLRLLRKNMTWDFVHMIYYLFLRLINPKLGLLFFISWFTDFLLNIFEWKVK